MQADIPIARAFDLTGSVLGGRYEVLGKLGEGGMASVYEGRRVGLRNRVAIKVLKLDLCEDPSNVRRFLREAKAASVIEHDNIVDILDFGEVDVLPVYYVMEFLEGEDLRTLIGKMGRLSWDQARGILLQVADALEAAHRNGIIHRDVKPANIYLLPDPDPKRGPRVKVLDFGIAKVVENVRGMTGGMTATNGILGTVAYMAPEQARGQKLDARTDVYQLGVVAYQMLAGHVPFRGNNPFMVLGQHVNETPRPLSEICSGIVEEAEAIVMTCLAKDPAHRFQSMMALRGALLATNEQAQPAAPIAVTPWQAPADQTMPGHTVSVPIRNTEKLGSDRHPIMETRAPASIPPDRPRTRTVPAGQSTTPTQSATTTVPPSPTDPLPDATPPAAAKPSGLKPIAAVIGAAAVITVAAVWAARDDDAAASEQVESPTPSQPAPPQPVPTTVAEDPPPQPEPEPEPAPAPAPEAQPEPTAQPAAVRPTKAPRRPSKPKPRPEPEPEPVEPSRTSSKPSPSDERPVHPDLKDPYR